MPLQLALACAAVALAPAATLATNLAGKPQHLLFALPAAFIHMLAIALAAALARALAPPTLPLLTILVLAEEIARYVTYRLVATLMRWVGAPAATPPHASAADGAAVATSVHIAVAAGLGVGLVNTLMLHGSMLSYAALPGSLYVPGCSLSVFGADAIYCALMTLVNVALCIASWTHAYPSHSVGSLAACFVLHCFASLSTYAGSSEWGGCAVAMLGMVLATAASVALALRCATRLMLHDQEAERRRRK